ncbi:hypothetical protein [Streptomyces sp. NPDC003032]
MLNVTRETKAVLKTKTGERVVAFTKDSEPGIASLAVPHDRAKLSPREMRELAAWLNDTAAEQEKSTRVTREAPYEHYRTATTRPTGRTMSQQERAYQSFVARGLR